MSNRWWAQSGASSGVASLLVLALIVGGCSGADVKKDEEPAAKAPSAKAADDKTPAGTAKTPAETKGADDKAKTDTRESLSPGGAALLPEGALDRFNKQDGLKATEEKALAQHYYEVGKQQFDSMDYSRAYENLRQSTQLDPTNQAAVELYYTCGSILGKREDELKSSLERLRQEHDVKVQLVRQEMLRFFEQGDKEFQEGKYDEAIRDLERAREMIAWYPYQVDTGTPPYRERAEREVAEAKKKRLVAEFNEADRREKEAIKKARDLENQKVKADERRIDIMLTQAGDLIQARRYHEAADLSKRVLEIEPHNPFAKKYLEYAILGIHTETDAGIHDRTQDEWTEDELNMRRVEQPKEGTYIDFPSDWMERTKDRKPGIASEGQEEPFWERNYKKILAERKVTLNFPDVPLQDVILFLQDITGLNFVIAQGIDATEKRISLKLKDIKLENALKIILEQTKLTYKFERESIVIVEPGSSAGDVYFEIYDISDILYKIQDFKGHHLSLPNPSAPGGTGGAGASLIFDDQKGEEGGTISPDVMIEIIKKSTGDDAAWGEGTNIEAHRGQLLVNNTREVHKKIAEVLENLRKNQGLFVHIETRFIDITNDMLEDVGVDFRGLGGNPGDERVDPTTGQPRPNTSNPFGTPLDAFDGLAGRLGGSDVGGSRRDFTPGTRVNAQGQPVPFPGPNPEPGNDNFVWRTMNVFGSQVGSNLLQGTRLVGGGGLLLQVTQLDHWQTNAILHAERETEKVRRLTAPRVTAANRERVYTSVITQRAYIADWELVSGGTGLVVIEVADPVIQTFQEGVVLEVKPTVSADRKFVTLDVRPSMATLVGGQIQTVLVNLGSSGQAAFQVPIGIPEISLEEAFTSVTIPDGGTALLGGFRQVSEQKNESTLPIIDSVPVLNVLFRRRGDLRETRSLIILITAKIVSIRDEEQKRYNKP